MILKMKVLAAAFLVLALLTVLALELADTQAKSRDDVEARVNERATLAAALIESLFESSSTQTPVIAARAYGGPTVSAKVLEANRRTSAYLIVVDATGKILGESKGVTPAVRTDLARSKTLRVAIEGRAPYAVGDVLPFRKTGVISYVVPFKTPSGPRALVTGFVPATLDGLIGGELRKIPGVEGARNYLIDGKLTVLSSTNPKRPTGYVFTAPDAVRALAKPQGTRNGRFYQQVPVARSDWKLVVAAPADKLFATVSGLRKWVPWLIFMGFMLVTGAAFLLGVRALRASEQVRLSNGELERVNAEIAEANAALARRAAELARSNDELEQFASIASHDLQEPLRKVRTFTQQLTIMEADHLSDKGRDYLQRTNAAAERMQTLIEDLLRFSRVSTRARPFAEVALDEVVAAVLETLEVDIEDAGASIHVDPLPTICGDASQLRQLMQNLISNAVKFRREDEPVEVWVSAEVAGDTATISVRDNGIGFEPQYEQRIFRVFERLHGRGKYVGTGIGLALCRKIAERHGGSIAAESALGQGATFRVTLPVDQREEVVTSFPVEHYDEMPTGDLAHA